MSIQDLLNHCLENNIPLTTDVFDILSSLKLTLPSKREDNTLREPPFENDNTVIDNTVTDNNSNNHIIGEGECSYDDLIQLFND